MVNVVAFKSNKYSVSTIVDAFEKQKWNLNILQNPICLHICITPKNIDSLNEFGFFKGCLLGTKRILSCHPIKMLGGGSGFDPVKKKRN